MSIAAIMLLTMLTGNIYAVRSGCVPLDPIQQTNTANGQVHGNQIKISIATGGGPYGPAKDSFRVGEPVPLVITMTNTGSEPVYVCESSTVYQDRPQLLRNGQPVPYASYRASMIKAAERDKTCQTDNLPQRILLRPNDPVEIDWFNLAAGAPSLYGDGWYETLPAGKYTLTSQRRLNCCDGAFIEANTINFMVVP